VEYSGNFLGKIPNIVVFQFNPESIARTIAIPAARKEGAGAERSQRERGQATAPPTESFTITAHFSAADDLGSGGAVSQIPKQFGVGPQLAALEKMVYPPATPGGVIGAALDAVASAIAAIGGKKASRSVPKEKIPRVLFIWGPTRLLPVSITSLTITEEQYDYQLNPVQAAVQIGLAVASRPPDDDPVGKGALEYSTLVKDTQATPNLAKTVQLARDIIPF